MAYCVECDPEHSPSSKQVAMALNLDDYKSHQADHRINLPRILQQFKDENVKWQTVFNMILGTV